MPLVWLVVRPADNLVAGSEEGTAGDDVYISLTTKILCVHCGVSWLEKRLDNQDQDACLVFELAQFLVARFRHNYSMPTWMGAT